MKKELLARALYRSRLLELTIPVLPRNIAVLGYHRIRNNRAGCQSEKLFDDEVLGPTQDDFERQVIWLKKHFDVLSESDLLAILAAKSSLRKRYAAITLDDGYRDNYTLAYPVLRAHSLPAICFVCPNLLDTRHLGWWDIIAYLLKATKRPFVKLRDSTFEVSGSREAAIQEIQNWMKALPAHESEDLIPELAQACDVDLPEADLQDSLLMTWEQLLEMSQHGIRTGSHTYSHRVLATLPSELQSCELRESKLRLETRLGTSVRTLAYPVGGYQHFTPETMQLAKEAGYEGAFSFRTGDNRPGAFRFNIRRIAPMDTFGPLFACGTVYPRAFDWLRQMPGSHRITAEQLK
jgi:peptidoglycan/xylan/chitin deacetylase (PgdA/CDA1 family)